MAPELRPNNGKVTEATTWVCKAPNCSLPYFGETLHNAEQKGMHIGLHAESRSIIVHFFEPQPAHRAQSKLAVVFGNGGAAKQCIEDMESFDFFHGESWGLIAVNAPLMPEYFDHVVEEDELESEVEDEDPHVNDPEPAEASVPEASELVVPSPDIFALVVQQTPRTIRVPGMVKALLMETSHQKELREAMEKAGGPLSKDLKDDLFPRGKAHVEDVQEEARTLARKKDTDPIVWITSPPKFLTIYGKPFMSMSRRVEWIRWKAQKLSLELTLPTFMAIFKQVTFYNDRKVRMQQFKAAIELWQDAPLDWKSLPDDERNLIKNINEGNNDCYCKNCSRVLDPKATTQFCSSSCASYFCSLSNCGKKLEVKMVTDYEQLERLQKKVGPYDDLVKLARMLTHKDDVAKYRNASDVDPKFTELTQKRKDEKCCDGVEGFMDNRWCESCKTEFQKIKSLKNCVWDIRSGKVSWGHCEEAARRLKTLAEIPLPKMEEKSCDCRPRKKARTV